MNRSDAVYRHRRRLTIFACIVSVVLGTVVAALASPAAGAATKPTYISLTFDDSNADQAPAEQAMKANGLVGTFYTVDGWVGTSGYLARSDLNTFAADGNEIAGHTVTHLDLATVSAIEVQRQICNDRATLQSWGFKPVDFAYPFASATASVEATAKACGYNTARGLGDLRSPASCRNCRYGETMPPPDPYYLEAPDEVDSTWTLATLQTEVTNAVNHGGGWVPLTFHHICSPIGTVSCPADLSITPTVFNAFVAWLAGYARTAANLTSVRTVDQVVHQYLGASYPAYVNATPVTANPPAPVGTNALQNPSLETVDATSGFPTCFQAGGWGTNTAAWAASTPGHTGTRAEQLTLTGYANGDAKLLPTLDSGTCSPTIVPGKTYKLSVWYQATGTTQFAVYYRDSSGAWYYWTSSPWVAPVSAWTQATFTTPAAPANAVGMSFGFALISNGTLVTDDYSLVDPGTVAAASAVTLVAAKSLAVSAESGRVAATAARTIAGQRSTRVHSHLRPFLPGGSGVRPGTKIAAPELGSSHKG